MHTQHQEQKGIRVVPGMGLPPVIRLQPGHSGAWSESDAKARLSFASERVALGLVITATCGLTGWLGLILQHAVAHYRVF